MFKTILYGYFTLKDVEIEGKMYEAGECIYIGIDTTTNLERHMEHLKPAKKNVQKINTWLQDRQENEDWMLIRLCDVDSYSKEDSKPSILALEAYYVGKYKPVLNAYKK